MDTELKGFGRSTDVKNEFSSQLQLTSTEQLFVKPHPCSRWGKFVLLALLIVIAAAGVGFVVGYFLPSKTCTRKVITAANEKVTTKEYHDKFQAMVDTKEIRKNLRFYTNRPHIATTQASEGITDYIRNKWKEFGFEVEEPVYEALVSLPQVDKPNTVSIINNDTKAVEYYIRGQINITASTDSNVTFKYTPYLAYAPNATIEGELVYVNAGLDSDFNELKKRNITVKGRIVIMGTIFGNVQKAVKYGAIGVILYPDPQIYAPEGHGINDTYPNSPWLPPDAVQSLSLSLQYGDPYTPLLPSTRGMYRLPRNQVKLPKIPAQTISYHHAQYIMRRMGGVKVPKRMKGGFDIDYRFGPLMSNGTPSIVKLEVNNQMYMKKIRNLIATIPGSHEPDRVVLLGNHRDAWSFGGADPSSGTTTLTEISRILSNLLKQGWRPKRTIKLCSWGGEEMALLGSNEWVEENDQMIRERAVAYLNTDVAVGGKFVLFAQTSPMLSELILKHTKKISDPQNSKNTLYDTMFDRLPRSSRYPGEPELSSFLYVSDNIPFCLFSGLSTADFSFFYSYKDKVKLYPLYHTQYDTFEWIHKFADPEFRYFKAMTQLLGSMLLDLSDSSVLPFSVQRFGRSVQKAYSNLIERYSFTFDHSDVVLDELKLATNEFVNMTNIFESAKQKLTGQQSPLTLRILNDQMANLEKTFIGTTWRPVRKIVFGEMFYNVVNTIGQFRGKTNETEQLDERVKFELSLVIQSLKAASTLLKPFINVPS